MSIRLSIWFWCLVYYLLSNALGDEDYWAKEPALEQRIMLPPELCEKFGIEYTDLGVRYHQDVLQCAETVEIFLSEEDIRLILRAISLNQSLPKTTGMAAIQLRQELNTILGRYQAAQLWQQLPAEMREVIVNQET